MSSRALIFLTGWMSTGMPRPLSNTVTERLSAWRVTSIRLAWPFVASSTALSTISQSRWCSPGLPVPPMYMPGRLRTGSSPSSTWMPAAV